MIRMQPTVKNGNCSFYGSVFRICVPLKHTCSGKAIDVASLESLSGCCATPSLIYLGGPSTYAFQYAKLSISESVEFLFTCTNHSGLYLCIDKRILRIIIIPTLSTTSGMAWPGRRKCRPVWGRLLSHCATRTCCLISVKFKTSTRKSRQWKHIIDSTYRLEWISSPSIGLIFWVFFERGRGGEASHKISE